MLLFATAIALLLAAPILTHKPDEVVVPLGSPLYVWQVPPCGPGEQCSQDYAAHHARHPKGKVADSTPTPTPTPKTISSITLTKDQLAFVESQLSAVRLDQPQFWVRVAFSGLLAIASLVAIFTKRQPQEKHWAYATIGTVLGYWLRM